MHRLLQPAIPFDGRDKLRHLLQTIAFSLLIALLLYAFTPDRPFSSAFIYSAAIGVVIWAVIDFGRNFIPSAAETGWPAGLPGIALVAAGVLAGYFVGNRLGQAACDALGCAPGHGLRHRDMDWRTSLLITAMGGAAVSFYFWALNRAAYFKRRADEARRHADEARLKLLETQLEPHMLFNTLANLRALIAIDPARAQQMLDHLIAYLRATLDASRGVTHPLQAEFDRLRDYLELMAIRMGPRLAYTLDLPLALAAVPVPTLLLQPLVENAIRHGLEPQVSGGRIVVAARAEGDRLVIEVTDSGVGLPQPEPQPAPLGKGFGLTQIRERLHTLHGDAAGLEVLPAHPGTLARVRMPLPIRPV